MSVGAYTTGIRQALTNKGVANENIGYDPNSGYVQVNGQNFMKPAKNFNGTTFDTQDAFNNAWNQYNNQQNKQPSAQSSTGYNPNTYYASGQTQSPQQYGNGQNQINDTLNYLMNTARNPQSYDVYSSPQYQAIKGQQDALAQQQYNTDRTGILARGMGDSTYLTDRNARINAQENAKLLGQVVPQLMQEHQAQQQQQFNNAANVLGSMMQNNQNQFGNQVTAAGLTGNFNGQQTLAGQNQAFNQGIQQANLTGVYNPYSNQIQQMQQNSANWFNASPEEQARLATANQQIGSLIGAYKDANGDWVYPQGQSTLANKQANLNAADQAAQTTGHYTGPKNDWSLLYDTNGTPLTQAAAYQQGQLGISQQNANTQQAEAEAMAKFREAQAARENALASGQLGVSRQSNNNYAVQNLMNIWDKTGVAPAGLESFGVKEGTPLASKGNATSNKNNAESEYISNIEQMTPDMRVNFFKNEKANIVKDLGVSGYNQLYNTYIDQWGTSK